MSIGTSLVLLAVGAVMAFAINVHSTIASSTVHWHVTGWILMAVGIIGLVISLAWMAGARRPSPIPAIARTSRKRVGQLGRWTAGHLSELPSSSVARSGTGPPPV